MATISASLVEEDPTQSREEIARRVGAMVTALVSEAARSDEVRFCFDPDLLAGVIADLVIDHSGDPDHNEIAARVAPFWSARRAREALDISRAAMSERRQTGSLLGLATTDGDIFYPLAQFEIYEAKVRVKPAIRSFMMLLRDRDPWTVALLLNTPAEELDGLTPVEWVRKGNERGPLLDYAERVNEEFER